MAEEYTTYTTKDGDLWCNIAALADGDAYGFEKILKANKGVPWGVVIPPGITIRVPVVKKETAVDKTKMPLWKQ